MTEPQFHVVRAVGFLLALGFAAGLQRFAPHARLRGSWRTNGALWAVDAALTGTVCGACACTVARWAAAARFGLLDAAGAPLLVALPTTVLALDLVSYGWHRANHALPFLWRFHRVHHSDVSFTISTGLRFHPGELLLSLPLRLAAVALLGAPVVAVVTFEIAFAAANLVEHGNIALPPALERRLALVCVTPALHRRHHSCRPADLDSNFGTVSTVWDRLLGTYAEAASTDAVRTGVPGIDHPVGLRDALAMPIAS